MVTGRGSYSPVKGQKGCLIVGKNTRKRIAWALYTGDRTFTCVSEDNRNELPVLPFSPSSAIRTRLVGCSSGSGIPNSMGQRVGEDHPASKLTQAQVDGYRDRYEAGQRGDGPRVGYGLLAKEAGVCKRTMAKILTYQTWAAYPTRWKRITV